MSVIVSFAMFPLDKGESMSPYVARIIGALKERGVSYELGPMATTFETATMAEAMNTLTAAHDALAEVANRIYTTVTIDSRKGDASRSDRKVQHVNQILDGTL